MKKIMAITLLTGTLIGLCSMASAWEVVVSRGGHHRHHHYNRYHHRPRTSCVYSYGYPRTVYYSSPYTTTVRRVYYPGYSATYTVDEVVDSYYVY